MIDENNILAARMRELGEQNEYTKQGEEFLRATDTTLYVVEANPQKMPPWDIKVRTNATPVNYRVMLKNPRYSYSFDYWGSIHEAEMLMMAQEAKKDSPQYFKVLDFLEVKTPLSPSKLAQTTREKIKPNAYSILTALRPLTADTFEEFCAELGFSTDSIKAEKIYRACIEQERALLKLFTMKELEALLEIN